MKLLSKLIKYCDYKKYLILPKILKLIHQEIQNQNQKIFIKSTKNKFQKISIFSIKMHRGKFQTSTFHVIKTSQISNKQKSIFYLQTRRRLRRNLISSNYDELKNIKRIFS
jgi:hypothetical protein